MRRRQDGAGDGLERLLTARILLPAGAVVLAAMLFGSSQLPDRKYHFPRQWILDAIRQVESGGRDAVPDGDGGYAIGPFQIHRRYWQDAVDFDRSLGGSYRDCRDREYAERVVAAYMRRWAPDAWAAGEAESVARIHNGGPTGTRKQATVRYWKKVLGWLLEWRESGRG